ncbi:serine/threonine protein kinase [Elysia marginata]|uniref:Serine/threonine protein kinase n=1 Tax=Elysia marginata TaxID=1093978 RepID=A0AAV4FL37_9GAST|nr:serine/threonine protein kinase [Elysia marginata]
MENILFDQKGHIQLTDFGLAKWLQGGEQTRTVCGTLQYMAPEVLSVYPYSHSADWWSLGILMYAMLAGRYPVDGADTHTRMAQKVFDCDYLLPSNVSDAAQDVINQILTKSPHKRLGDMYTLQDLHFFQDVFFPDLLDKKISPIDVVPPDFFPMTGESWAPHLLTEEEMRNFEQFDGVNNNYKEPVHGAAYPRGHQRQHYQPNNHQAGSRHTYKHKDNRILRQQSTPEQLNCDPDDSYSINGRVIDWYHDGNQPRSNHHSYRDQDAFSHMHQNRDPDYLDRSNLSQVAHQYQQPFENVRHSSSEADNLSHRSSNYEASRRRSQDLISYQESNRSTGFSEWDREMERPAVQRNQHNDTQPSSSYYNRNGRSIELEATSPSHSAISPSATYKTVEPPPTVTLKAPTTYGSDHHRTKHSLNDHKFSNQTFGYLGPGPPYNVDPIRSNNSNNGSACSQRQIQTRGLDSHPGPSNSKPVMEYKTVEAPPTITLPTGPNMSAPPVATRSTSQDRVQPGNSTFTQYSGLVVTAPKQYNTPPPVAAKPVVPPKPQNPVRPQPAPRKSLQRQSPRAASNSVPSNQASVSPSSSAGLTPTSQPQVPNSIGDFTQRTSAESLSSTSHIARAPISLPYPSPREGVYTTNVPHPFQGAALSSSGFNSSFDQNGFRPAYSHGSDLSNQQDGSIERPLNQYSHGSIENRYSDRSQGSVRSPTSQSNFKWKLPANVAPSFV